ncbi:hypothetical protein GCM10020370_05700 [Paenibacillus hodogayensis]
MKRMERSSISIEPMLPSENVDESIAFYRALGFEIVRDETFPYRFAEVRDGDLWLMTSNYAQHLRKWAGIESGV